jgi:hypothetical protein
LFFYSRLLLKEIFSELDETKAKVPFDYLFQMIASYLFMDAADVWVLVVSLSEQETCAMLIMFMDAAIGWVLDVSLSKQETCAMFIIFMTAAVG